MKQSSWILVALIVILLGGVYFYRGQLKAMFMGGSQPAPVTQTTDTTTVTPAAANDTVMTKTDAAKGDYLVGATGMTLYIFDKDTKGVSNCTGNCLTLWPPYGATSVPGTLPTNVTTLAPRADGSVQFAYKGMPLYYYAKDAKPGDITGDGFGGIWHLVKP